MTPTAESATRIQGTIRSNNAAAFSADYSADSFFSPVRMRTTSEIG